MAGLTVQGTVVELARTASVLTSQMLRSAEGLGLAGSGTARPLIVIFVAFSFGAPCNQRAC
eukprot:SAG22_NODE_1113_length_5533_cov_5.884063_4_plen_61_part_00